MNGLRLARYLLGRLVQAVLILLVIAVLSFLLLELAPGDMADILAGEAGAFDPAYAEALRARLGLDQPFLLRLGHYLLGIVQLDLGESFRHGKPVAALIAERFWPTLLLVVAASLLALSLAIVLSILASRRPAGVIDRGITSLLVFAYGMPVFWVGLVLILVFSLHLGWFPTGGMETLFSTFTGANRVRDILWHLTLPAVALALFNLALYTRLLRASLREVLEQDYIRTVRAQGMSEARVVGVHALSNALLTLLTTLGNQVGATLGGAVVVETVFSWPGLGRLVYESLLSRDTALLVGVVLFGGCMVVLCNLLVDLLQHWLDPRVELP
ncbi:ABC transporter permease [Pseudomonas sp. LRF_L74]|uniref:ABC transporter permease n=1 Tax=Pseudomonas sp. LRF_L74 TaxID=3369422 RepID=UPI003F6030E5